MTVVPQRPNIRVIGYVQSYNENEIDELMNDSDTKFISPEGIKLNDNPDTASVLTLEANVHVVDEGTTTHTKELETNKKKKKPE